MNQSIRKPVVTLREASSVMAASPLRLIHDRILLGVSADILLRRR